MRSTTFLAAALASTMSLAVGGCANGQLMGLGEDVYVVTSATPDAITLRFREGDLNKATSRAEAHCRESARTAQMVSVMPDDGFSIGTFRCT